MNVAIIDFKDSFTFNIYSIIKELGISVVVVDYEKLRLDSINEFSHIILGPGPGRTENYRDYFPVVDKLVLDALSERVKLIGICLGHQLIHQCLGREVFQLEEPIHGQSIELVFPESNYLRNALQNTRLSLQFYNSWAVRSSASKLTFDLELFGSSNEVIASFSENITTYQFHCESIGTSFQKELFLQFLV